MRPRSRSAALVVACEDSSASVSVDFGDNRGCDRKAHCGTGERGNGGATGTGELIGVLLRSLWNGGTGMRPRSRSYALVVAREDSSASVSVDFGDNRSKKSEND